MIKGYAAAGPGGKLELIEYDLGPLGDHQVDVKVEYCGICHSDIHMIDNAWGMSMYPLVAGHEVIGRIESVGAHVKNLVSGQRVGVGWNNGSCNSCEWCLTGNHNLCTSAIPTVLGRYGGFSERVRAGAEWAIPIPDKLDPAAAGPLLCGGVTVFNPLVQFGIKPTDKTGVIGIGGLGHLAIQFLDAWGCEVTAFSSNVSKAKEARQFGADHFVSSTDPAALSKIAGTLDFIISTVDVPLDWNLFLNILKPKGRLHHVGALLQPMSVSPFPGLIFQKSISGSPVGSPPILSLMLEFAARHNILPKTESFKFSQINEAIEKLRNGNVRYRVVLEH
jgi:alcohol/geraniol dehydrogenase (NADP+)